MLTQQEVTDFQEEVWRQGRELYRPMPWRENTNPYFVLVSEIMLQQTQVDRVVPKFEAFIATFPSISELAEAPLSKVLELWSGLGYNRRAKFLHEAAKKITTEFNGVFPETEKELISLPGVGVNTAGAILAYSFNHPSIFIETNVRTVYFYHFFQHDNDVTDTTLKEYIVATLDAEHPREWYWAIMDYGSHLKRSGVGANNKSRHYKKQTPLKGSVREVRGSILKELTRAENHALSIPQLEMLFLGDPRFVLAFDGLKKDGLVYIEKDTIYLAR
ncbi:A/G-specific adenine glycosylase [Candidatus Saccharibacteria bacterium TM7i]|nr:A/G-specific adenine glycosylase [Candidatus Saccharibacteria bacterium TM7i]